MIILLLILLSIIIYHNNKENFLTDLTNTIDKLKENTQQLLDETPLVKDGAIFIIDQGTSLQASVGPQSLHEAINIMNQICISCYKLDDSLLNKIEKNRCIPKCNQSKLDVHNLNNPQRHQAVKDAIKLCSITIDNDAIEKCNQAKEKVIFLGGYLTINEFIKKS